ncbi:sodium channel protein Nach-like [Thrips palmi]|uniref:Sodium channel protein Nach-like n=1 Tax=Thrips palmi TaxID=161013 RepID=A0A6P8Z0I1_THRPL|nr:sodium channel protein Nach-like [Thrips palmi]
MAVSSFFKALAKGHRLFQTSVLLQTREYFDKSTLHGVRYIAETRRPFYEKFMWFCTTSIGTVAALVIIASLWQKFQTKPTITGLDTDFHNWDVPFPAITLCQSDPSNRSLVQDYVARHWKDANEEKRTYYENFLVALANISYDSIGLLEPYFDDPDLPQTNLKQIVYEVVSRCHVLVECAWKGDPELDCCPFFTPIFTENGFCYSFNLAFNETEWPYEYNRRPVFRREYIQETDMTWSMSIDTDDPQNNTVFVYIGSSDYLPTLDLSPHHSWTRRISRLSFEAKETYTTEECRQLSIQQRRCVFADEIDLVTDDKYTFAACMRQCRMELAQRLCGCLPFFYPPARKVKGYKYNFRYCSLKELGCIAKHAEKFSTRHIECNCELGCKHTVYEMEKLHEPGPDMEGSPLEIGFVSWPMVRYKREVLFGWVDLLVAFGGIAGLFLGFSLLSGVEIVYYFTVRALCMVCRDKDELQRLTEEYDRAAKPKVDLSLRPHFMEAPHENDSARDRDDGNTVGGLGYGGGRGFLQGQQQRRRMSIRSHNDRNQNQWPIPYLP